MLSLGVGLVPEDRKRQGLVLSMNARENITLPSLPGLARGGFLRAGRERQVANAQFQALRVKAPSTEADPQTLSGGNQQKLVLAKWLAAQCDVLMLDEPTRGVDVGAKAEIHALIRGLAREGKAVLVISSELPELLALCSRILVMRDGGVVGEVSAEHATEGGLLRLMTGTTRAAAARGL
jgi:ABC-type sugar transport system ATPase subunit